MVAYTSAPWKLAGRFSLIERFLRSLASLRYVWRKLAVAVSGALLSERER